MGEIIIYRGSQQIDLFSLIPFVTVTKAEHVQDLLSTDRITLSIASSQPMLFYLGDYIVYGGRKFTLNLNPTLQKQAEDVYLYDMQFEGVQYDLLRKKYFNYDAQGFYTTGDFPLTGEINVFLTALINNAKRDETDYTWILGQYPSGTTTKTITFSNVNCLAALQTICQEFEQEFEIVQDMVAKTNTLHIRKVGTVRDFNFEYGYGNGLYSLKRDNVSEGQVITRLYPYGSTENIPTNYRNFSPRLRLPESYGTNYIQDNAKVALFGLVEEIKNYDEIKPTFKGIVSGVGTAVTAQNTFSVSIANMDFDLNEKKADGVSTKYLIDGTPAKIHVNKGNLAGYDFEIHKYEHTTKTFEIKVFADERGQKFPDLNTIFKFAIGDEITLLDIIMPDVYITNAENKLKDKALEDYDKLSQNNVKYSLDIDPMFFANIGGGTDVAHLTIGDYISVKDTALGIQKTSRIISLSRDLLAFDGYKYSADISDSYEISIVTQILQDIQNVQTQVGVVVVRNKEAMLAGYQRMKELQGLVFDPDGYFDPANIKPNSIETNMLTVGAKSQQLSLESVIITANKNNDPNLLSITAGKLIHFSISDTGIKEWNLVAVNKTLPTNEAYYIYARVPKVGKTGTFNIVTSKLKFDSEDLYYNFLVAVVFAPSNNLRMTELMYGSTFIHGRTITTGRIQSVDGLTWFDLDTGQIKGKIEFLPDSPAYNQIANTITVGSRNLVLKSNDLKGINQSGYIIWEFAEQMLGKYTFQIWCENTVDNSAGIGFGSASGRDMDYFFLPEIKNGLVKFTVDNLNSGSDRYLWLWVNNTTNITKIKVEKGSVGTDWTPAPEDIEEQISIAENTAIVANQLLADIANDNKLTPGEKQSLKKEYDIIIAEKPQIQAQANTYGVNTTAYINAYNALISYTNPLLVNLNVTDDIVGSVLRNTFNNYYTTKVNLLKAITDRVNDNFSDVYGEMDRIEQELSAEIEDVNQSVSNLNSYVDGAFSDGIISAAEAVAIEKYINQLNTEKGDIEQKYNQIYNDTFLTGTPKNELSGAFGTAINGGSGYLGAHNNLISSISIAIKDGLTTPTEKADVDSKFVLYKNALTILTTKFQSALSAIEQAKIDAIQVGGRNLLVGKNYLDSLQIFGKSFHTYTGGDGVKWFDTLGANINGSEIVQDKWFTPKEIGNYTFSIWIYCNKNIDNIYVNFYTASGHNPVLAQKKWNGVADVITATINLTSLDPIRVVDLLDLQLSGNPQYIGFKNAKLEKGNKATDWTPAPEDVNEDINNAQITANNAITLLTDIGNDNKLTASEKQTTLNEWNRIKSEYLQNYNQASTLLLSVTSYQTAYNSLNNYIAPLLTDLNSTSNIDGNTFRSTFKNYYDQNVLIVTAIGNKQIENVQVGGRNFLKNSGNFRGSGWNGGFSDNGGGYTIDTNKIYLGKPTLRTTLRGGLQHNDWLKLETGKEYTYSALVYGDYEIEGDWNIPLHYWAGYNNQNEGKIQVIKFDQVVQANNWKLIYLTFKLTENADSFRPFLFTGSSANTVVWLAYLKLEKGNKATDWVPAIEDTSADIAVANQASANALAQAQNAINTANAAASVTSFMQTTIDGNVISTGTLQVGDVNGANAMISGVTDKPNGESIRFAAGKNYANKYLSPFQVLDNGMVRFVNPTTGNKTFELGFNQNTGKVVFDIYNENGVKIATIGTNGIEFTGYIPESYSKASFKKLNTTSFTESAILSVFTESIFERYITEPGPPRYYDIGFNIDTESWLYNEGRNFESAGNAQYVGYYPTQNKLGTPIPDGIYVRQLVDNIINQIRNNHDCK